MSESPDAWFAAGKTFMFKITDELGERMLIVTPNEPAFSGDPCQIVLDIEARTRTRVKDGGNPCKFIRAWQHWNDRRDPNSSVSFAEFCARRHHEWVDVLDNQARTRVVRLLHGTRTQPSGGGQGGEGTARIDGEWSAPMTRTEIARRITGRENARPRKVQALLDRYGLQLVAGRMYQVRLDKMESNIRKSVEKPV